MERARLIFFIIVLFSLLSCRKEKNEIPLEAGFIQDNPVSIKQGDNKTCYLKIGLNAVADRDVYIKYLSVSRAKFKITDSSYFVIKKGEQYRSIPFILLDNDLNYDTDIVFEISQVYHAEINSSAKTYTIKALTDFLPTAGTANITHNSLLYPTTVLGCSYGYDGSNYPYGYRANMVVTFDKYALVFTFNDKVPDVGKKINLYQFNPPADTSGYSYLYDYPNNGTYKAASGSLTVSSFDTVNKTLSFDFSGIYNNGVDTLSGVVNYSHYNELK
jgi:hypothetical protein